MAIQNIPAYLKNSSKKKKTVVFLAFILVLMLVGIGIAPYINTKTTPPINPVLGDNRYRVDPNALMYEGSVKSFQGRSMGIESGGKTLDIDIISRVSIFKVSNSTQNEVLQVGNTVATRFSVGGNAVNKAVSVAKIKIERIDNNSILLNGSIDPELFDVTGKIVEVNGNSFTIETDVKRQRLTFEVYNTSFISASITDESSLLPQTQVKVWAREMGPRFRAILIVI